MQDVLEIGSVSIFVNVPEHYGDVFSADVIKSVQTQVTEKFELAAKNNGVDLEAVRVTGVCSKTGCIVVTISLGVVVQIAAAGGVLGFIAAYPKIRTGLIQMAKDVKSVYFRLRGKKEPQSKSTALYRADLLPQISEEQKRELIRAEQELKNRKV